MSYVATDLFPDLPRKQTSREQRAYVMSRLVEMAEAGTLHLTDCVNQPGTQAYRQALRDYIGGCILGHGYDVNGNPKEGLNVPRVLNDYRVRLVSILHRVQVDTEIGAGRVEISYEDKIEPITFRAGRIPIEELPGKDAAKAQGLNAASSATELLIPDIIETGETDVQLYVREAWKCLRKMGEHFVSAPSRRSQAVKWQVREVRPGEEPTQAKIPKKAGRPPRKAAGQQDQANA